MSKPNLYAVAMMVCKPAGMVAAAKLIQKIEQQLALMKTPEGCSLTQDFLVGSWALLAFSEEEARQVALSALYERYPMADGWVWYSATVCPVERGLIEGTLASPSDEGMQDQSLHSSAVM